MVIRQILDELFGRHISTAEYVIWLITILAVLFYKKDKKEDTIFKNEVKGLLKDCFHELDTLEGKYPEPWSFVEEWKKKMTEQANSIIERYRKEGETDAVLEAFKDLDFDLADGLNAVKKGKNPLKKEAQPELSLFGKCMTTGMVLIPALFLYILLSGLGWGIVFLSIIFGYFNSPFVGDGKLFNSQTVKKWLLFIASAIFGLLLNQWTYTQSDSIQIAITISLPIIFGLTHYKLAHKKDVREI